jgi:hypothetical protein
VLLPQSGFLGRLIRLNGLEAAGFAAWELLPGMCFGERTAWWRAGSERDVPHEGIDLCGYRTGDGRTVPLPAGTRVPVLWPGEVVTVVADFLGRSVFVSHGVRDDEGRRLHSVYGHLRPRPGLESGCRVGKGDEVGTIAEPAGGRRAVPPHLHVTVALFAEGAVNALGWEALRDPARAVLLDPFPYVCARMPA